MWISLLASGSVGGTFVGPVSTTTIFSLVSSGTLVGATSTISLYSAIVAVKVGSTSTTTIFRRTV